MKPVYTGRLDIPRVTKDFNSTVNNNLAAQKFSLLIKPQMFFTLITKSC
jgi:hypothetical protein